MEVPPGENRGGLVCPYCHGGRTNEPSLSIKNTGTGLLWICHRANCGRKGAVGETGAVQASPGGREPKPAKIRIFNGIVTALPEEIENELASKYPAIAAHGQPCGWSSKYQRSVWPVHSSTGTIRGYELRSHDPQNRPKTLHYRHQADPTWCGHIQAAVDGQDLRPTVVVEDLISAWCVSRAGFHSVSLMGTNLNQEKLFDIVQAYPGCQIALALDRDATRKAIEIRDRFSFICDIRVVPLQEDLKYNTAEEIRAIINGTS